jgi:hypothetical protein
MTVCGKDPRQFLAYARRGPGNQRHTLYHDANLLMKSHGIPVAGATTP